METLDHILTMWEKDAVVDRLEPGKELTNIPILQSKYLREISEHRMSGRKVYFDIQKWRKIKWDYYTGKMPKEDLDKYGWEPFRYTLKSDVNTYLEADPDLVKLYEKKAYHDECEKVLDSILGELKQRTWQLKEYCAWERFIGGQ